MDYPDLGRFWSCDEVAEDFAQKRKVSTADVRVEVIVPGSGRSQTTHGCPSFKEVIKRKGEKMLVLVRRTVHTCDEIPPLQVVAIVVNDVLKKESTEDLLEFFTTKVAKKTSKIEVINSTIPKGLSSAIGKTFNPFPNYTTA